MTLGFYWNDNLLFISHETKPIFSCFMVLSHEAVLCQHSWDFHLQQKYAQEKLKIYAANSAAELCDWVFREKNCDTYNILFCGKKLQS